MKTKQLWGVMHDSQEELAQVLSRLKEETCESVGLEIGQDTLDSKNRQGYFGVIAAFLEKNNTKIIALESRELSNTYEAITLACQVYFGQLKKEELDKKIDHNNKLLEYPKEKYDSQDYEILLMRKTIYEETKKILKETLSSQEMNELFNKAVRKREEYIKEKILKEQPDISIVGVHHLNYLSQMLKEHKIIAFSKPKV